MAKLTIVKNTDDDTESDLVSGKKKTEAWLGTNVVARKSRVETQTKIETTLSAFGRVLLL